jgi:hypothetical protein
MRTILTTSALLAGMICLAPDARSADLPSVDRTSLAEQASQLSDTGLKPRHPLPASWKWSLAPVLASQALDATSSYGMRELNPVLAGSGGRFGMQFTSIKLGVTGALLGVEYLIVRAHPGSARVFTKLNWAAAALTFGVAAHNYAIR